MNAPVIRSANRAKGYRVGRYEAALLNHIESDGSIGYEYIVAVFEPGAPDPFLFVTSERNDPVAAAGFLAELGLDPEDIADEQPGSHFLCVFDEAGHGNLGKSDDWADQAKFEAAALAILRDRLGADPVAQ
jgi:hypothetical protein